MSVIRTKRISSLVLLALLSSTPIAAQACPVCFSADEGSRIAFIVTTVFLSVLPWLMVGSFVVWYQRQTALAVPAEEKEPNPK